MVKRKIVVSLLLLMLVLIVAPGTKAEAKKKTDSMSVISFNVGQGDATLVSCKDAKILVDCGDEGTYKDLKKQLDSQNVNTIDAFFISHHDSDHMGAADMLLADYDVKKIYMPERNKGTKQYEELIGSDGFDKKHQIVKAGDVISVGKFSIEILGADGGEDVNDSSIVMMLTYGKTKFLFTGDASAKVLNDIMAEHDVSADWVKVPHHGSDSSSPILFCKNVGAEYAVISCGKDNSYGHPHKEPLARWLKYAKNVLRTDELGMIVITSDGKNLTCKTKTEVKTVAPKKEEKKSEEVITAGKVIGNKKSKVYHDVTCKSLPDEKNRVYFESDEAAEKAGYHACGNCHKVEKKTEKKVETPAAATKQIIGNKNSKAYHVSTCRTLPDEKNRVYFDSIEAAEQAGYHACGNCLK